MLLLGATGILALPSNKADVDVMAAYSSHITLKKRPILEQLMRKSFSLERPLGAMAKHHEWLEGSDTQMLKLVGLIMDVLSSENKRLSD
ncbi:hypothetical protein AB4122_14960 [Vibrio cyclitrophicus]|uniref:hypothetical protein n=1 Tax=Vibrio cyclitrophicus TaxID=47951 RepID=UPI0021BD42DF|nr:hypothetical protein [Vibrio cyclitrophicus]